MPNPLAIARRIAAMKPDEIRTRAGMLLRQRIDGLQASLGRNPLEARRTDAAPAHPPRFFFDPGAASALAAEVRKRLPEEADSVTASARRIQEGSFDLLGYKGLSFGTPIDWQLDAVHRIRAPFVPWFRVPYLEYAKVGDHKITWELSRHQHLMVLARAWLLTGEAGFLESIDKLWESWRASNQYPFGINWCSALEVAFRCLSWIWVDRLTSGRTAGMRQGIGESAVYIERYISTYFAPNTHLLGEALALFFVGVLYPEFERSAHWREYGWNIVVQESERQVRRDGFHFEQSVYYHVYALDMFLHGRILAARNGVAIPPSYDEVVMRMAEGLSAIGAAGQAPRFGDDDGGRLFDGRRNRPEHMLDPLAAAAIVYGRADWKARAGDLREETIWLLGLDGIDRFEGLRADLQPARSRAFEASGYYVLAADNAVAVVDAGPHGWGRGGHGHADALSLQLMADGRAGLTDPGTCFYPKEKPERDRFRGTAAHNTLEVDCLSQAEPVHSFGWRAHPKTTVHRWHDGRDVTIFHGSHDGYMRLEQPVTHARWVIAWPDCAWLVRDVVTGQGVHRLEVRWHLSPEHHEQLSISNPVDSGWTERHETGEWSPAYGASIAAPVLRLTYKGMVPAECGTLLGWNHKAQLVHERSGGASVYLYRSAGGTRLTIFATRSGGWQFEDIESDAEVLGIERSNKREARLFCAGATWIRIAGTPLEIPAGVSGVSEWTARVDSEVIGRVQERVRS